ncbi:uncharacterized protein LOC101859871 [Aplysia californica]|uniref:Uncharacterized protein LOC101859871 n=1 Tax=Aplysia californica TaxID=6500 RepID=A0ABM0JUS7_APLCA|nr:uncharacterized protein LOC101859871 [Aplysia californica]
MGSGSSKANNQLTLHGKGTNGPNSVANVNNGESTGWPQRNVSDNDRKADERGTSTVLGDKDTNIDYNKDGFGRSSPLKPIEPNKKDKEKKSKEKNKDKGNGSALQSNRNSRSNVSALVFEGDSDFDDDIDEVLKIPVAADTSKHKDKEKKNKKKEKLNNDENNFDQRYDNGKITSRDEDEPLPETYAQRLQRKQYKLQQDMLLREKTIMRSSQEWDRNDDDVGLQMEVDSPQGGFDPSKFRAANKGHDTKKELFTTVPDDLQTPRYLQTSGQDLDEVEVDKRGVSPSKQLPRYNQSELDLMEQLEQEIL